MPNPRQLLINLLHYIREQAKKINPSAYNIANTQGLVRMRKDLFGLPGVLFDLRTEDEHVWLRVQRLKQELPPKPASEWQEAFRISPDPSGPEPTLEESVFAHHLNKAISLIPEQSDQERQLEVERLSARFRENSARALESYLAIWRLWASGELPRRRTISLYDSLFTLKQQIEAEQTSKPQELVWGMGMAAWQLMYEGKPVQYQYPVLTQAMELSVDSESLAIEVIPRAVEARLEFDVFFSCKVQGADECEKAALDAIKAAENRTIHPFDAASYSHVLKLIAGNLDSQGEFRNLPFEEDSILRPTEDLVITDGWVILARERSTHYLFEDLKRLQTTLEDGCEIPAGPLSLVTEPSSEPLQFEQVSFRGLSSRGESTSGTPKELYFPLAYNDEQVTIIQRLERAPGVTVQGPPGTGKTHTIANIICHYLASGKRVLVTSKGESALREVRDKLPEGVKDLAVALLASDQEGMRQFQASISTIQHRVSQLNEGVSRQEILRLQSLIDRAHAELTRIDRRVDDIALNHLSEIEIDGKPMRASKMAELVVAGEDLYAWFNDVLSLRPEHAPPLSLDEGHRLRAARRSLGTDLAYAHAALPVADHLPNPKEILALHQQLCMREDLQREQGEEALRLRSEAALERNESVGHLLQRVDEGVAVLQELESLGEEWPQALREECRISTFAVERAALEQLLAEAESLAESRGQFLRVPVTFPEDGLTAERTLEAVKRAAETGKPFPFLALGNTEAKEHIRAVRVSGKAPSTSEDWTHVHRYTAVNEQVRAFGFRWNALAAHMSLPSVPCGIGQLQKLSTLVEQVRKAHRIGTLRDQELISQCRTVFATEIKFNEIETSEKLEAIRRPLLRHLSLVELRQAEIVLDQIREMLVRTSGPISLELQKFFQFNVGNPSIENTQISLRCSELLAELTRIWALKSELDFVTWAAAAVQKAGALNLAQRLLCEAAPSAGNDSTFPPNWRGAWDWARMKTHLDGIDAKNELKSLAHQRSETEAGLAKLYREMVSQAAWLATKQKATPKILSALNGYATAVHRIGRGTGPNAIRYRRDARNAMREAQAAVPCWIMDHSRISESMPAEIGSFHLVIVDEASQSDLWALPAILRGEKILVVGDDKQVSPDGAFIRSDSIGDLLTRFLSNQWFKEEMTPEKSLYDLAARVFAANQVMLREHFRCVEPIIEYSNHNFYGGQIKPLRIARPSERLDPPLIDIYVEGGVRNNRDCNEDEARAIADEIQSILSKPELAGRTLGVVALLGPDQAKHIDQIVREKCDPTELYRRKFLCGDPTSFQGSERSIIFLSMVADPSRCTALSGNKHDQKFNVAASRAQDRMYLVRSVTSSDLSDKDIRKGLLAHFDKPIASDKEEITNLTDKCDSGFEKEMFLFLADKKFRVIPQVKAGSYRIDMVVEGANDARLAIECDGDPFHGPDRWQQDMHRQRILERAGWQFWRCFHSTWILHKDEMKAELLAHLAQQQIEPLGAFEHGGSLVEKRIWKPSVRDLPLWSVTDTTFDTAATELI